MSGSLAVIWVLVLVIIVLAYEGIVRQGPAVGERVEVVAQAPSADTVADLAAAPGEASCIFAASYAELEHQMPDSVHGLIAASAEQGVSILGGTFGTFAKVEANLRALRGLLDAGHPVRLLMLDPDAAGVGLLADQKRERGQSVRAIDLEREIRFSLNRLRDHLGAAALEQCCRLYPHIPRNSVYCLGDAYVVTIYKFGAGASSPCIFLRESDVTQPFCDALDRSFDDIWNARLTRPFTEGDLVEPSDRAAVASA
ncbi:MAG: hypothetical protein WBA46_06600 [Thermomicrobiales bacterium]